MAAHDLVTHLEIVLSKDEGRIVRMGVTRASGVDRVRHRRAQLGAAAPRPSARRRTLIVSPDGNVYLHWEFHRDPFDACTTRNARPFVLASAPPVPTPVAPPRRSAGGAPRDEGPTPGPLLPLRGHLSGHRPGLREPFPSSSW